jgi:hypothetical protein
MTPNEIIISILEDQGLKQEQISDIMGEIAEIDTGSLDPTTPPVKNLENEIRQQMDLTNDWRQKAKLAARIISINLD